jgi:serine/threonine protein kinase/tetratricopeptide (TPR) repeat protein
MSEDKPLVAGRYQIEDMIGRGGMGDVYRGTDTQTGEKVAIKRLHEAIVEENPDIVDRFKREGEALRKLDHPNIVKLLDAVEENGKHYLVMEYVGGGSLRDLIDEQARLPLEAVLNIALDLTDALTRAHRLNIIHRDIKPDNVLLAEDGTPRLTDFGVAHMGDRTRLTQTGSVIGTYAYLSPEACNGLELDERADIWAFGVMLFEMLAGRVPFQESGTAAILTAILTKPAPDITRLREGLPDLLVQLVYQMLEKDRMRRVSSVRRVGAELEALIRGLDTPLRDVVQRSGYQPTVGTRFATPSSDMSSNVPAMERSTPDRTHGLSLFPAPIQSGGMQPPAYPPGMVMTPGGSPYSTAEMLAPAANKWKWIALMVIVTVLACAGVVVLALVLGLGDEDSADQGPNRPPDTQNGLGGPQPPDAVIMVESVAPDEFMVLVAQLEPVNTEPREVTRFILDNLEQTLEIGVPFSKVRIRSYPAVIKSADEAEQVARENAATVIIWGSYTASAVQVEAHVGTTAHFGNISMDRRPIEQAANVRVRLTDEQTQSVAPQVLGVLATLQGFDGDIYEYMRTLAVMDEITVTPGEIVGDNVAAYVHRYFVLYHTQTGSALDEIDRAIEKDATNPFLYALRSVALQHQGLFDEARRAAETAQRLGPDDWVAPLVLLAINTTSLDEMIDYFDQIVAQRPGDWYMYSSRGSTHYTAGHYDQARADLELAITLKPNANYPYALAAMLAVSEGRFADANQSIQTILDEYPDPELYSRIVGATVGGLDSYGPIISAFINLTLGRYEESLESAETAIQRIGPMSDLYMIEGLAYCNLRQYNKSIEAYTEGLRYAKVLNVPETHTALLFLLRGSAQLALDKKTQAQADFASGRSAGDFDPAVLAAFETGELGCENFFSEAAALDRAAEITAPDATPAAAEPLVEPVEPGEYMVLVGQIESLDDTDGQNVTRFIVNDLEQSLEETVAFSNIVVRAYPDVITSDSQADDVAAEVGAVIVVWGNTAGGITELEIQIGVTDGFPYLEFQEDLLERTTDVRVQMTNPQRESVTPYVLTALNILQNADGNGFESLRTAAINDAIIVTPAEVVGSTVAANLHRSSLAQDPAQALENMQDALDLDAGNALLYVYSGTLKQQNGQLDEARRDFLTAQRIGPANWPMPMLMTAAITHDESVIEMFNQAINLRPDDWFLYYFRGAIFYEMSDEIEGMADLAKADLDQSITLKPEASFPYVYSALLALHEGRLTDAGEAVQLILTEFPDPTYMRRLIRGAFGDELLSPYALLLSAFTNLTLGQYTAVVETTTAAMEMEDTEHSDAYLMQGIAYCGLSDYAAAETSFSSGINADPGFVLLYVLRADARLRQDNAAGAADDFQAVAESAFSAEFEALAQAVQANETGCADFFTLENPAFSAASETQATDSNE